MTPFKDEIGIAKLEKRLGMLVRRFEALAPGMSDLPLYNEKVGVEAVDFIPFGVMGLGALVTPWFINLVFLPLDPVRYDGAKIGQTTMVELPAGLRGFTLGGDEVTGLFWAHSVMSPLTQTLSHDAATTMARAKLADVLSKPAEESETNKQSALKSRREFVLGIAGDAMNVQGTV
jgi:[NiFe] hydrogenase assembly HybE family chaperone